jgi:hypothetical protein
VTAPTDPNYPNVITVGGAFDTGATGVDITGLTSVTNNPGTTTATMSLGGTLEVLPGLKSSDDQFTIKVTVSQTNFSSPTGPIGMLADSTSSTLTNTTGATGDKQTIQSWYDGTNTPFGMGGTTVGPNGYLLPKIPSFAGPISLASTTFSTAVNVAPTLYSLTNQVVITITGNSADPNAKNVFGSALTLTAVPEPASLVVCLTGMPVPLVLVGLLRRRRRRAAA